MGFDGETIFVGKRTVWLKDHAPHSIFVHCHCHKLQLARAQAANSTNGIKNVYTYHFMEIFHYSSKRCISLKEVHALLELPVVN